MRPEVYVYTRKNHLDGFTSANLDAGTKGEIERLNLIQMLEEWDRVSDALSPAILIRKLSDKKTMIASLKYVYDPEMDSRRFPLIAAVIFPESEKKNISYYYAAAKELSLMNRDEVLTLVEGNDSSVTRRLLQVGFSQAEPLKKEERYDIYLLMLRQTFRKGNPILVNIPTEKLMQVISEVPEIMTEDYSLAAPFTYTANNICTFNCLSSDREFETALTIISETARIGIEKNRPEMADDLLPILRQDRELQCMARQLDLFIQEPERWQEIRQTRRKNKKTFLLQKLTEPIRGEEEAKKKNREKEIPGELQQDGNDPAKDYEFPSGLSVNFNFLLKTLVFIKKAFPAILLLLIPEFLSFYSVISVRRISTIKDFCFLIAGIIIGRASIKAFETNKKKRR